MGRKSKFPVDEKLKYVLRCLEGKDSTNHTASEVGISCSLQMSYAKKRGGREIALVLDELLECIPDMNTPEQAIADAELEELINVFLHTLPIRERNIFLRRYWYVESLAQIAKRFDMAKGNVKGSLYRSRMKLKAYLEKEGVIL